MKVASKHILKTFKTVDVLNTAAAEFIIELANKSIADRGQFVISLSGGQTPKELYKLLSESPFREQVKWEKTFVFWSDERCVPLNDERNNAHQAKLILLDKVNIPSSNIHFIPVNLSPADAAAEYEKDLKIFFKNGKLRFDLMLLGLGENGHTASLFPDKEVIKDESEGVRAVFVEEELLFRITMTAPLINSARTILFLVTGKEKAKILNMVLTSSYHPLRYPAQIIEPSNGELFWLVDSEAAYLLKNEN